jgi:hypothetical protein
MSVLAGADFFTLEVLTAFNLLFREAGEVPKARGHAVSRRQRLGGLLKYYGRGA